jgi:hypothetical protein
MPTDDTDRRSASSGRILATFNVNVQQNKIMEILIRLTKSDSFQKGRKKL